MRPTAPLLALTVLQGLAGGLIVTVACWWALGPGPALWPALATVTRVASVLAAAGAGASFFHMHRPQAGRYVLRRLATSWLSREALTTGLFVAALVVTAWGLPPAAQAVGVWISAGLGLIAMAVTALVYATLPAMRSWHSPLTVLALMGTGLVSGAALAAALVAFGPAAGAARITAVALLPGGVALAVVKILQVAFFAEARQRLSAQTGTGLPRGPWRLQDPGTSRPPYRTQPQVAPPLTARARGVLVAGQFLWLVALPLAAAVATVRQPGGWTVLGGAAAVVGAGWERWWFFADATHSSRIWFQDQPHAPSRVASPRSSPAWASRFHSRPANLENKESIPK